MRMRGLRCIVLAALGCGRVSFTVHTDGGGADGGDGAARLIRRLR